ncbi:hypothetical protein JY651_31020 [Pyxidicoccus parkwayensis]|jgi:hypothetical protein|uniref:Uncharacterized protein n=1 Tax=Pyxidicoccus parkwayensis TaxID=2813578 RepID=A0ABX7NLG9_9BACT|nr:hypothetical protein [Pyxidicoccus parkwaysis]QSQ19710.1 hypothetical protein JY651_31020 [Pyxidicoccus parkwaysis]
MRKIAVLASLLGLFAAIPVQAAELKDVFGKDVPIGQGRPTLVLYANRGTRDELRQSIYKFIYDVREQKPIVVVHVDLRDVPGLFKGMAKGEIKKSHLESLDLMRNEFREHGQPAPAELDSSLFMVADAKGEPHQSMGLNKGFDHVVATVLNASGQEVARGPFPDSARKLGQAMGTTPPATVAKLTH